jgi:hypothetical protein
MRDCEDDVAGTADPAANAKFRKRELERSREINCGLCPYHRGENAERRPDRSWKNRRKGRKQWA